MLILLILVPLVWISRFKDYRFGAVSTISAMIVAHTTIALFSQFFGIFSFKFLLTVHSLIAILSLVYNSKIILNFFKEKSPENCFKKIPWVFIVTILIIGFQFYLVHSGYTGKINTYTSVVNVENFNPNQPYFSDEWIAVGMSEKVIETKSLPFTNFLNEKTFQNFLFVFHSLIAEIDLLFDLDLLNDYSIISITFALILITFIYVLLRSFGISVLVSALSIFFISYLPNASNLPLLWYLLPWNIGFIFFIGYFIAMQKHYLKTAFALNFATMIFYPPLVLLALPSFIFASFELEGIKKRIRFLSVYIGIILVGLISAITFISFSNEYSFSKVALTVYNYIFRPLNSFLGAPPLFIIWQVLPWFITPFAFWGLWKIRRKIKYISVPVFIGLIMWFLYSINLQTFLMDYHRTVAMTAILMLIISAFALEDLKIILEKKFPSLASKTLKNYSLILLAIIFFSLSFSFTQREPWKNFKTLNYEPAPPANHYLIEDDIKLFSNITNEKFLAPPWKGLVLAVATKNLPVVSKPSTLTMNLVNYDQFLRLDCAGKNKIIDKLKIKYLYIPKSKCENFEILGTSSEGLSLYLVK
ncbi:MAG: hypothetical protein WC087_03555 [Candidatus Paceibacterota bacterium]